MPTFKRVLAVTAAVLAVLGILVCLVALWFSWSLNTPVTEALTRVTGGVIQIMTAADNGLTRVDEGLSTARGAAVTVEETAVSVGDTIVETDLAFAVLEATVGDTLFPRVASAREIAVALADTLVAVNETLEAANRLPFVDVPTLSTELAAAADQLAAAQQSIEETRAELRAIKEEKVARPVTFITDRTGPIIEKIDAAVASVQSAQARIAENLSRMATLQERLPRWIDLISLAATLVLLWLAAAQGYVLIRAIEYVRGRRFNWGQASDKAA